MFSEAPAQAGILFWGDGMDEQTKQSGDGSANDEKRSTSGVLAACAEQLASAAGALEEALGKLGAQYESLNQKVDRIVAAIELEQRIKRQEITLYRLGGMGR